MINAIAIIFQIIMLIIAINQLSVTNKKWKVTGNLFAKTMRNNALLFVILMFCVVVITISEVVCK